MSYNLVLPSWFLAAALFAPCCVLILPRLIKTDRGRTRLYRITASLIGLDVATALVGVSFLGMGWDALYHFAEYVLIWSSLSLGRRSAGFGTRVFCKVSYGLCWVFSVLSIPITLGVLMTTTHADIAFASRRPGEVCRSSAVGGSTISQDDWTLTAFRTAWIFERALGDTDFVVPGPDGRSPEERCEDLFQDIRRR
jgi:hypothetical protein